MAKQKKAAGFCRLHGARPRNVASHVLAYESSAAGKPLEENPAYRAGEN